MSNNTEKKKFTQPWVIRRGLYLIVAAVGLVAAGFGLVDEGQLDAVAASPLLATVVGVVASLFTNRGSDSTATGDDVRAAQQAAQYAQPPQQVDPEQIAQQAAGRIADLIDGSFGTHIAGAQKQAQDTITSVADFYRHQGNA